MSSNTICFDLSLPITGSTSIIRSSEKKNLSIEIVRLPVEYDQDELDDAYNLSQLFSMYGLKFGTPTSALIVKKIIPNSSPARYFKSAYVDFSSVFDTPNTQALYASLANPDVKTQLDVSSFGFHMENGKPFTHFSIRPARSDSARPKPVLDYPSLELPEGAWSSIYVQNIPANLMIAKNWDKYQGQDVEWNEWTTHEELEQNFKNYFRHFLRLGVVSRVDFVKSPTKPDHLNAFVHFESWSCCHATETLRANLERNREWVQRGYYSGFRYAPFYVLTGSGEEDYQVCPLTFKINRSPIPVAKDEYMNIHQYSARVEVLEAVIVEKDQRIAELEAMLVAKNASSDAELPQPNALLNEWWMWRLDQMSKPDILKYAFAELDVKTQFLRDFMHAYELEDPCFVGERLPEYERALLVYKALGLRAVYDV